MGGAREILRSGVLLGTIGLVRFQGSRDVLPLAAKEGQPDGLVGELDYDGGRRRRQLARDGILAGGVPNSVDLRNGVRELGKDVDHLASLGGDQDRLDNAVVDSLGEGLGVVVVLGGVAKSIEPDRTGP